MVHLHIPLIIKRDAVIYSSNKKYIDGIINNHPYFEIEHLTKDQQYNEYVLTSLRTMWGADNSYIKNRFDLKTYKYFDLQVKNGNSKKKSLRKGTAIF